MGDDISKDVWAQCKEKAKVYWGELTDHEIEQTQGKRDLFVELLQERYVILKEEAEKQFDGFKDACDADAE